MPFLTSFERSAIIIDLATARIIMYLMQKIIEDEEARKRLFYIITIPITIVLFVFSSIHYLFTLSVADLHDIFANDYEQVEPLIDEYGYYYGYAGTSDFIIGDYSGFDAIDNKLFADLMNEATKYIGYEYTFGGSDPLTGFDCSSFVCWSYTKSGVYNLPRTTAQGIFNQCDPIAKEGAKAGDLIFFHSTYDSVGIVSHVGIYLGNGKMLHCGSPIGYANTETAYWQNHLYAYGRLPIVPSESEAPPESNYSY